ncbi:MAG: hypothetical protein KJO31_07045 [Gammaproteobacteria bacterium]|nr:hypothetical protein [Gammaproteobacteria bacterium]
MSTKGKEFEIQLEPLKSESARQRWELFHRAIAHAKQSNQNDQLEAERAGERKRNVPVLSIAR